MALLKIVSANPDLGYVIRKNPNNDMGMYNSRCYGNVRGIGCYDMNEIGLPRADAYLVGQVVSQDSVLDALELQQIQPREGTDVISAIRKVLASALKDDNKLDINTQQYIELRGIRRMSGAGLDMLLDDSRISWVKEDKTYDTCRASMTVKFLLKDCTVKDALRFALLFLKMEEWWANAPSKESYQCSAELMVQLGIDFHHVISYSDVMFRGRSKNPAREDFFSHYYLVKGE